MQLNDRKSAHTHLNPFLNSKFDADSGSGIRISQKPLKIPKNQKTKKYHFKPV